MKFIAYITTTAALLLALLSFKGNKGAFKPNRLDYDGPTIVRDSTVAKQIADIIWKSYEGNKIENMKGISVELRGDTVWIVRRFYLNNGEDKILGENGLYIEITKKDCQIREFQAHF